MQNNKTVQKIHKTYKNNDNFPEIPTGTIIFHYLVMVVVSVITIESFAFK